MKSASEKISEHNCASDLARILAACGFAVRLWRSQRIYLSGYGRDISAYLEPGADLGPRPCDGVRLEVRSNWQAARYNGLRCKGVKHAILHDLWTARLLSESPPARWQDVTLCDRTETRSALRPYEPQNSESA